MKNLQTRILYPARFLILTEKSKPLQTSKFKKIQHHQASFTTNAKEIYLGRKHKRKRRPAKNKPRTVRKMVIRLCISIITLKCKELNAPTKTQADWVDENICVYTLPLTTSLYTIPQILVFLCFFFFPVKLNIFPLWLEIVIIFFFFSSY